MAVENKLPLYKLDFPQDDWESGRDLPMGTIVTEWHDGGLRIIIMRSRASFNCYVGVPSAHPLAGHDYDLLPVGCHWGLTFGHEAKANDFFPNGYYWYGWDYCHLGDANLWEPKIAAILHEPDETHEKKWTPAMIKEDAWRAISDFKSLMKLAESIKNKANG